MNKTLKLLLCTSMLVGAASLWMAVTPRKTRQLAASNEPRLTTAGDSARPATETARVEELVATAKQPTSRRRTSEPEEPDDESDEDVYGSPSKALVAGLVDGRWVTQGDILVSDSQLVDGVGDALVRIVEIEKISYWERGVIPYVIEDGVDAAAVKRAFREFEERTNVRFVEFDGEDDYVAFRSTDDDKCESYLGRKGGEQEVVLGRECTHGQLLHELMHALGFVHEHSREDRDDRVTIVWENVQDAFKNQFQKLPADVSLPVGGDVAFDFDSILLYPSNAFTANGEATMVKMDGTTFRANRRALSELDIEKVNRLYP